MLIRFRIDFPILFLILFITSISSAQEFNFERLSLDQGLSQSIVNVILKDSKGFMWIGTESGLNRYDGYNFLIYKEIPFDSNSLSNNNIISILEDHSGYLWIGTAGGGLNKFDRTTEKFTRFLNDPADSNSLRSNIVPGIYEDSRNELWVITNAGGIDRYDRDKNRFYRYTHHPEDKSSLSNNFLRAGIEDTEGNLWIGSMNGINKYDRENDSFSQYFTLKPGQDENDFIEITAMYEAPSEPGIFWIGVRSGNPDGSNGLMKYNVKNDTFKLFSHKSNNPNSLSSNFVTQIYEDNEGILWIGTSRGLNNFDRKSETFINFQPDPANSLSDNNGIRYFIEDINGGLWIRPFTNIGVYFFDKNSYTFKHFQHDPNNSKSLSNNTIQPIYHDSSGVSVGRNTYRWIK